MALTNILPSIVPMNTTVPLLAERYKKIRAYTEDIFHPLETEDYIVQAALHTSPPKWSLGHTSWFFETFLLVNFLPDYRLYDERFPFLFNSYYNNAGDRVERNRRGDLTRPTVKEVYAYRKYVDTAMLAFIENAAKSEAAGWEALLELGLQHEQQHQELFWTDLKYTFAHNPLFPKYSEKLPFNEEDMTTGEMNFINTTEGIYPIGHRGNGFCYDNELGLHKVYLHGFQIADRLVTNAEYLEFVEDGGYKDFNLWHDEAWAWINENKIEAPLYWLKIRGKWMNYTLSGFKPIESDALLKHVSFYEAFAFAGWKGLRLPTEFEWEAACGNFRWGQRWEHTSSAYLPYPSYQKAAGAVGEYNGKFMVNQMVLRGASVATSPGHRRFTYRNFFHPWERWQYTGIRLAK
ncbi:MAG: ergothioneine biosynthesis protein EgtB [Bacteroidales bacterium]|nr:ergothioneine biosynthesis protein EgtB [Bacteroidales bacterium]